MTSPNDDQPLSSSTPEGLISLIVIPTHDDAIRDLGFLGVRMALAPRPFPSNRFEVELRRNGDIARRAYRSGFVSLN